MQDHVLITRPQEDVEDVAAMVTDCGFSPFSEPMLKIVPLETELPDFSAYQALIFTSMNAVRVVSSETEDRSLPVYIVGEATRDEAEKAGWSCVGSVATGEALQKLLEQEEGLPDGKPLLHLSGEHVAVSLFLKDKEIERLPVYRADKITELSTSFLSLLDEGRFKVVLFFSARTAEAFVSLLDKYGRTGSVSSIKALCLSERVLESTQRIGWQDVQSARTPDKKALFSLLQSLSG